MKTFPFLHFQDITTYLMWNSPREQATSISRATFSQIHRQKIKAIEWVISGWQTYLTTGMEPYWLFSAHERAAALLQCNPAYSWNYSLGVSANKKVLISFPGSLFFVGRIESRLSFPMPQSHLIRNIALRTNIWFNNTCFTKKFAQKQEIGTA